MLSPDPGPESRFSDPMTLRTVRSPVECTSTGALTRLRIIGELLLLEKNVTGKNVRRATSHPPNKFSEVTSLHVDKEKLYVVNY